VLDFVPAAVPELNITHPRPQESVIGINGTKPTFAGGGGKLVLKPFVES